MTDDKLDALATRLDRIEAHLDWLIARLTRETAGEDDVREVG